MSYHLLLPEIIITLAGLLVVLLGITLQNKTILAYLSLLALLTSLLYTLESLQASQTFFQGAITIDTFSQFFKAIFLIVAILVVTASTRHLRENQDEYYSLILFSTLGMMIVASASDLLTLFVGFELASMATYILAGFEKKNKLSLEAATKYFVIGSLASAILLYGISLVYGLTGETNIPQILGYLNSNPQILNLNNSMAVLALVFLITGFGFKMALFPFHNWAPDTYQGSPHIITAFLAAASKKMVFAAAFRVLLVALIALKLNIQLAFAVLAVATMTYGNLVAISQTTMKRMLAYSSIAQAGYISLALVAINQMSIAGGLLMSLAHAFMKGGAFLAVAALLYTLPNDSLENFKGLSKRAPLTALLILIFLLSLAGIPPTGGFIGKLVLFYSLTAQALTQHSNWMLAIVVIAILNSALSIYYYARVIKYMYVFPPTTNTEIKIPAVYTLTLALAALGVIIMGIHPQPFIKLALEAAANILGA